MACRACTTEIRAVPGPGRGKSIDQQDRDPGTDNIEKQSVVKDIEALDYIVVIHDLEEHDLRWNLPHGIVVDPCLFGYLFLDHELDGDL